MLQWHEKAVDPPGDARSEAWFVYHLGRRLKARAADDPRPRNAGLRALTWDYPIDGPQGEPDIRRRPAGDQRPARGGRIAAVPDSQALEERRHDRVRLLDLLGRLPAADRNRANERAAEGVYGHGWGFTWPADRRILYNRASARPDGDTMERPEETGLVGQDGGRVDRHSTRRTSAATRRRTTCRRRARPVTRRFAAMRRSSCMPTASAGCGSPTGLKDGPLPAHYEPHESPVENRVYAQQAQSRGRSEGAARQSICGLAGRSAIPLHPHDLPADRASHRGRDVAHALASGGAAAGALLRDLAGAGGGDRRQRTAGRSAVTTPRGSIVSARAGHAADASAAGAGPRSSTRSALPWHWGHRGLVKGDIANDLVAISEEPNVKIMEAKALRLQD